MFLKQSPGISGCVFQTFPAVSLEVCGTSRFWSWTPPCCVPAGGTRPALTGTARCSSSSAATATASTATRSWADGSPPSAGQRVHQSTRGRQRVRWCRPSGPGCGGWRWCIKVCGLFGQRHWTLADGCVSAAPPAGWQQMHPDHEDGALVHALARLPQPEVQNRQSDG